MSWRTLLLFLVALALTRAAAASPDARTVAFWNRCVAATEGRIDAERGAVAAAGPSIGRLIPTRASNAPGRNEPSGTGPGARVERVGGSSPACAPVDGDSATIQNWRGSIVVPHITVDQLVNSLRHVLPEQEDVVAAKFLARPRSGNRGLTAACSAGLQACPECNADHQACPESAETIAVALRIVRRKIITVVFDTEHEMTFDRRSPALAFSRSVMTKVVEVEDAGTARERPRDANADRGFLWKLNAYSSYVQQGDDVLVTMESLTLSRDVPWLVRPIAGPIIDSIARESMVRTLEGLARRRPL